MFCSKCGKKNNDSDNFCANCGTALTIAIDSQNDIEKSNSVDSSENEKNSLANNTVKYIGLALTIIGLVVGIFVIIFMSSSGEAFGYDSWNYYYGGGRETCIGVAVFAAASFLIGLCMTISSYVSNKQ